MEGNSLKSFENLCKIFEMRIKLDNEKNIDTPEDVLINYEKYAKKIDAVYNSRFEKDVKPLITPAVTIEKEEERLKKLIKLLEERLEKRESLENRFYMTTGRYIKGIQPVVSESELSEKKDRLELITKYLETKKEIESITVSIAKLKNSLLDEEDKKEEYTSKNKIMEEELCSLYVDTIHENEYFKDIKEEDIDTLLVSIIDKVKETKETLDVTKESVSSLIFSGTSDDYSSYVEDAEKSYFVWKNRELLLRIYELVLKNSDNFSDIFDKRVKISSIIKKRKNLMASLNIDNENELLPFEKLLSQQINTLSGEKEVLENISNYTNRINFKEERLRELEEENNAVEILSILREYGLIDTYDGEEVNPSIEEDILEEETIDEIIEEPTFIEPIIESAPIVKEVIDPYRIVEIKDYPKTLNIGLAKLKGESVREKVNKKLNPKREEFTFNDASNSINSKAPTVEFIVPDVKKEEKKEEKIEEVKSENKVVSAMPVWEMPSNTSVKSPELKKEEEEKVSPIPVWYDMNMLGDTSIEPTSLDIPKKEDKKEEVKIDISSSLDNGNSNTSNNNDNNMFWVPVSDGKLENNTFPDLNIPTINNTFNSSDNFGFPDLKGGN